MGEAFALASAVLGRGEEGTQKECKAVRILVILADGLGDQIEHVAADLGHGTDLGQGEAVLAFDGERDVRVADVIEAERAIEETDEGADRAGSVVVLGLAQQQRAAPFDVAQVDIVAQRRAHDLRRCR